VGGGILRRNMHLCVGVAKRVWVGGWRGAIGGVSMWLVHMSRGLGQGRGKRGRNPLVGDVEGRARVMR
jgi:hypothetical protein